MLDGLRTAEPLLTLAMLAPELDVSELVTVMEALRSTAGHYPGLVSGRRPMATADDIAESITAAGAIAGVSKLRVAAGIARDGVESPAESRLRWLIVQHGGLPEPEINVPVRSESGEYLGKPDMSYRRAKVAVEYEGDHHRTDRGQWREDIRRGARFTDNGWLLLRATGDDLGPNARAFVQRVAAALARASRSGAPLLDEKMSLGPNPKVVLSSRSWA